ncbi:MAG: hypothetical protein NTY35_02990 [Planctomycetota bacterium]|nr:hypothetical protein [Planctomycetota bacterium]
MTWHTLRTVSPSEANLTCGFLDGFGVQLRVIDSVGVEVARDALGSMSSPVRVQAREVDLPVAAEILSDALPEPSRPARGASLDRLGLSIRACAVSTFFAPLGLALAPTYLLRAKRAGIRPREHAWTLAGIAACVPASLFYVFAFHGMFLL